MEMRNTNDRAAIVINPSVTQALAAGSPHAGVYVHPISEALAQAIAADGLTRFAAPYCIAAHTHASIYRPLVAIRSDDAVLAALRDERDEEARYIAACDATLIDTTGETKPPKLPDRYRYDFDTPHGKAFIRASSVSELRRELTAMRRRRDQYATDGALPKLALDEHLAKLLPDVGGQPSEQTSEFIALAFGDALPAVIDEARQWHTLWRRDHDAAEAERKKRDVEVQLGRAAAEAAREAAREAEKYRQEQQTRALLALCDPDEKHLLVERRIAGVLPESELWQSVQIYVAQHQGDVAVVSDQPTLDHDCDRELDSECEPSKALSADAYRRAKAFRKKLSTLVVPEGMTVEDKGVYQWDTACNTCEVADKKLFYRVVLRAAGNLSWRIDMEF